MSFKINLSKLNTYIIAVSGGLDSMVLLDYLIKNGYKLVVVNFNHQKRSEAHLEHLSIEKICNFHNIPYHYIKLKIKKGNFQEEARNLRYEHLESVAVKHQTNYIVTAHHADDLAETILMKLLRGSNLLGYSSMQKSSNIGNFTYLKPLLDYAKEDLYAYAKAHQVIFNEDSSNLEDHYLRNRIRHNVIPLLKEENDVLKHFKNFSDQTYQTSEFIRLTTKKLTKSDLSIDLVTFKTLHIAIQTDMISYILESFNITRSFEKINVILKQLLSDKPNIEIKLSKAYYLVKAYQKAHMMPVDLLHLKKELPTLTISHNKVDNTKYSIELCYNKLDFPIQVRRRLPGDMLMFSFGRKKLKSYLIDKKIPKSIRDDLIVITDTNETILWIPDLYINDQLGNDNIIYLSLKE